MATSSINKSIEIKDDETAKAFLDAIESSRQAQKDVKETEVQVEHITGKELRKFFKNR